MNEEKYEVVLTDDSELHPQNNCPSSGDWLGVYKYKNGSERWIICEQCNGKWVISNAHANESNASKKE